MRVYYRSSMNIVQHKIFLLRNSFLDQIWQILVVP